MKFKIEDLKKAVEWLSANSKDVMVTIREKDDHAIIQCTDQYLQLVEIKIHYEGRMAPKILKEEVL